VNIAILRWFIWMADYQQDSLRRMDWPRSPMIDDRKAQLDGELIQCEMRLRYLS
jgi:hypothetical protein